MPETTPLSQLKHHGEERLASGLFDQLKAALTLDEHIIWGHGTYSDEVAAIILEEGIMVRSGYTLTETAIPLSYETKTANENIQGIIEKSNNWQHRQAKFIVLLGIPFGINRNNVMELVQHATRGEQASVPPRFIVGYIDVQKQVFSANPRFTKQAQPTAGLIQPGIAPMLQGRVTSSTSQMPDTPSDARPATLGRSEEIW